MNPSTGSGGGFDAIVGNPPYIKIQNLQENNPVAVEHLKQKYFSAQKGNYDIYIVFVERALNMLKQNGVMGYILPHKFFNSGYGYNLRELLINEKAVNRIIHFDDYQIFKNASTYTCLLFLTKSINNQIEVSKINKNDFQPSFLNKSKFTQIDLKDWKHREWNIISSSSKDIIRKWQQFEKLSDITTNIFQGPKAGADNVFIFENISITRNKAVCYSKALENNFEIELGVVKKYVKGKNIRKYHIDFTPNEYALYPYDDNGKLIDITEIKKKFPLAYDYLSNSTNKKILLDREKGRFKKIWWSYSRPQNMQIVFNEKILTPFNAFENSFALDQSLDFVFSAGVSGAYGIILKDRENFSYLYLLALLNSKITEFMIRNISTSLRGGFYSYENKYIRQLPIKRVNFSNTKEAEAYKQIEQSTQQCLKPRSSCNKSKQKETKTTLIANAKDSIKK